MQTYEIAPEESMESLVRSLSRLARRDKDITLIVPAGVNPFTPPESVQKLNGVMRSYDARVRVQAADPTIVHLFQDAGFLAGPLQAARADASPVATGTAAPASAPAPAPAPARAAGGSDLPDDIANMNFDYQEVGSAAPAGPAGSPAGAGAGAPAKGGGGFFQRLLAVVAPPAPPARSDSPSAPPSAGRMPDWRGQGQDEPAGASASDDLADESGASNLDVTMPDWLRDAPPDPGDAGSRVVGRMPASNLDVTMPHWLNAPAGGTPAGRAGEADLGLPSWMRDGGDGPGATTDADLPDWLRAEPSQPLAPAAGLAPAAAAPPAAPAAPMSAAPEPGTAMAGAASAPAAPPPTAAPGWDLSAMAGPQQTAESIGQAVRAAGLDARTRALLLFGMALVRLAPGEATGAAAAARQAGCSDDDLRLVVQMAQALGGGPSERLGRRILG